MTSVAFNFVFVPAQPRIEPGDCVAWVADSATHNSGHGACPDDAACGSPSPPACLWDTGNVATSSRTTCLYDPAQFGSGSVHGYYCRIHASPTTGTMRGTLVVTSPILLAVARSGSDALLSWTGGGVAGDETFKVARNAGNPSFPAGTTVTVNPDGGVTGRSLLDSGALVDPTSRYYLVRNKQENE